MSEQSAPVVLFYDIGMDERRPVTQEDVDQFGKFMMWHIEVREIVSALTGKGASSRFTREQLGKAMEVLGLS